MTPLRLLNRQPKLQRHGGLINSDRIVGAYLDEVERLPQRYTIVVTSRVSLVRKVWRWLMSQIGY